MVAASRYLGRIMYELGLHRPKRSVTSQWARRRLKSPASRLFTQPFVQAQIKENIKALRHWPLCGEFTGGRWITHTKGQWRGKCFHLMTSSNAENVSIWWRHHDDTLWLVSMWIFIPVRQRRIGEWRPSSDPPLYAAKKVLIWCLFPHFRSNDESRNQNNTRVGL